MPAWTYHAMPHLMVGAFVFAFGACLGSFVNVLVHRLPAGISVVSPPSRCPRCGVRLGWRENIPVLGWILLLGRCRACRTSISVQYPGVEALVGSLCVLLYLAYYASGTFTPWWTEIGGAWFASNGPLLTLPLFALQCMMIAALVAMTLIDARLAIVTLEIPVTLTAMAFVAWPIQGWLALGGRRVDEIPLPLPSWPWLLAGFGALAGLVVANVLLRRGAIESTDDDFEIDLDAPLSPLVWTLLLLPVGVGLVAGGVARQSDVVVICGAAVIVVPLVAGIVGTRRLAVRLADANHADTDSTATGTGIARPDAVEGPRDAIRRASGSGASGAPDEIAAIAGMAERDYPRAWRLVREEVVFLLPVLLGAIAGGVIGAALVGDAGAEPPIPLACLGGSVLGYLMGGGLIWAIRLAGTAGFGREAMGLGDVHLLGAIGAVMGWIDPIAAVILATGTGISWAVLTGVVLRRWSGFGSAMPFGPHLAVGCLLVIALRPASSGLWHGLLTSGTFVPPP